MAKGAAFSIWLYAGGGLLIVVLLAAVVAAMLHRSALDAANERLRGRSTVLTSPYGHVEYTVGGSGHPVLIVHGAGGGFDQGELIAQAVLNDAFHWIAPSRFGYLRSTFHVGAGHDEQARAYAWLLDHMGIERVAVVALSAGGPTALVFSILYPNRVSSLTLLSAGVTPVATESQAQADWKGRMLVRIFANDFLFWTITTLFKRQFMQLMGADREVIASLSSERRRWIEEFITRMSPASLRSAGAVFDNMHPPPGERIAAIRSPVLIVHAEDDRLQLYDNAAFAAAHIPGAKLLRFARGGHFVTVIEQATVGAAVREHIRKNAGGR